MKDLKAKFVLKEKSEFKYFEVKLDSTDMVVDNAKVYEIVMPTNSKETYFLVMGDLVKKRDLIRQIDPAYKSENVMRDQMDFLERIKAKENAKVTSHLTDVIDDDLDDLDELGISDDDAPELADVTIDKKSDTDKEEISLGSSTTDHVADSV